MTGWLRGSEPMTAGSGGRVTDARLRPGAPPELGPACVRRRRHVSLLQQTRCPTSLADLLPRHREASSDDLLDRFLDYVAGDAGWRSTRRRRRRFSRCSTARTSSSTRRPARASRWWPRRCSSRRWRAASAPSTPARSRRWSTRSGWTLCREFGPEYVGLSTGDASVNRDAPILCCTAEVLANIALREGADADVQHVVMDEFHYYADRDRGVAWQTPLLTMPQTRFLLMSATLGDTTPFEQRAHRAQRPADASRSSRGCGRCRSSTPTRRSRCRTPSRSWSTRARRPAYVVHFTQADAAGSAQDFTSLKICHARAEGRDRRRGSPAFDFSSPYGAAVRKWLRHGDRPASRGAAAEVPRAGRAAGAARAAEGDLRHRHAGRRHQRARSAPSSSPGSASSTARRPRTSPRASSTRSPGAPGARASTIAASSSCRRRST